MPEIFLPFLKKEGEVSGQSEVDILLDLIALSPYQQRRSMQPHRLLMLAAQSKADEMSYSDYFGHTSPLGVTANENVRWIGYFLSDEYAQKGNNCESISVGGNSPQDTVAGWYRSEFHRIHVFGLADFYREQECMGVGHSIAKDGRHLYVFISCHCS